ncbi:MAG: SdpI family protein [Clostridiales bacterium]|nr:SdpI family protein [Clostridiales bacterium]
MAFWLFMLAVDLLIPGIMMLAGHFLSKKAPDEINCLFGYRTTLSMKNKDTWEFANTLCGRLWKKWGVWVLNLSMIPILAVVGKSEEIIGITGTIVCLVQLLPLIAVIPAVEKSLRAHFDADGKKKDA